MTTKDVVEALLFLNPDSYNGFRIAHILNDTDRNWVAKEHNEYPFISAFTQPHFLIVINKQIHTYIIGENKQKRNYNIINVEGYNTNHLIMSKGELKTHIKENVKEKVFLPDNGNERIIFLKNDNNLYIFNRMDFKRDMYAKSEWTIGTDIYSMSVAKFKTSATEIINHICDEF